MGTSSAPPAPTQPLPQSPDPKSGAIRLREIGAVYVAGVLQGIILVSFPALSVVFQKTLRFSTTKLGMLFVPQAILAIGASLLGARWSHTAGSRKVLLAGLSADLGSMLLLACVRFLGPGGALSYGLVLCATAALGAGFGLAVPALNTFAAAFFPKNVDRAVLVLNALLGLGTFLAPLIAIGFINRHAWWILPALLAVLTLALLLFCRGLPLSSRLHAAPASGPPAATLEVPPRFWIFAAFALVYGICETVNGNWAIIYVTRLFPAKSPSAATIAGLCLTMFWAVVTGGRVLFALIEKWCSQKLTFRILPGLLALAFVAIALSPPDNPSFAIAAFGFAGFGCSALLPLAISFGQRELKAISASVASGLIACYQIGYGLIAVGVGPIDSDLHISLRAIFGAMAVVSIGLGGLALIIARASKEQIVKAPAM